LKNHDTILEPSAGQGSIIEHINKQCSVIPECFELMETNKLILNKTNLNFNLIGDDFLNSDNKGYSKIVANPPFSKNQDITHVYKMYEKLNRGGRIVTIMSKHWQNSTNKKETDFRNFIEELDAEVIEIEVGQFKESGTNISSIIVILDKPL